MRTETRLPEVQESPAPETRVRTDRFLMVGLAIAAVWVAVGAMSLFTPDLVTDIARERVPLAALTTWFWGTIATAFIVTGGSMGRGLSDGRWRGFALTIAAIWTVVAVAAIYSPTLVTSDPTEVPLAVLIAPFAGMIGTAFASLFVAGTPKN